MPECKICGKPLDETNGGELVTGVCSECIADHPVEVSNTEAR